jgi:nucleotide-binding universal stress UspA family protein
MATSIPSRRPSSSQVGPAKMRRADGGIAKARGWLALGAASIGPSVDRARCTQLLIASSQEKSVMLMGFASDYNATKPQAGTGVGWEFIVRDGSPGEEIVEVVKEIGADLVVVGSNRHSSLHNLILGSTAAHLTAHSPAPVLVMRSHPARSLVVEPAW